MERYFDILSNDINNEKAYKQLSKYMDTKWLFDYELDEQGLIPKDIKRGVLSQDALYNLLDEYDD